MKKLLVTGGCGFIGSEFVRRAISSGFTVFNIDALLKGSSLLNLSEVDGSDKYFFKQIDIRDRDALVFLFADYQPDALVHFAAESHVDRSIEAPYDFISTNVVGTFNLLSCALEYCQKNSLFDDFKFLHISTDEVFGCFPPGSVDSFVETSAYAPRSPYSASKASSDHLVRAWFETYGLPTIITNCSNNYGHYQDCEKLIPKIIKNCLGEEVLPVYGDGLNVRDWLHVSDHVSALFTVLALGEVGQSYNIGANNEWTNIALVNQICSIMDVTVPRSTGSYFDLVEFVEDRRGHDFRYSVDASKISLLGWSPTVDFQVGLRSTIQWYSNMLNN